MVRLEGRFSESVNGYFLCDRGRYGFFYTNHPERPRLPKIGTEEVSWIETIRRAAEKLSEIAEKNGSQSVACLGSTRSSLENQAMLKRICELQGWREPAYFVDPSIERKAKKAVSRLDAKLAISMREIERADFIIAVGADPVNEAPMLALAMRQAHRGGATIAVIDPRPVFLPFEFHALAVSPDEIDRCLNVLVKMAVDRPIAESLGKGATAFYDEAPTEPAFDEPFRGRLAALGQKLRQSKSPVIVCGTQIVSETTPGLAADHALLLHAAKNRGGLFYLMPEGNTFGAALLSSGESSLIDVVESVEKGSVRALILIENNPFWSFPDHQRLRRVIDKLELFLVMDYLPSPAVRLAHIFFPTRTLFEMETSFVNQEGRVQFAPPAHCGGIPISQISAGGHPPRVFRRDIPGGEPEAAWQIMDKLANAMSSPDREISSISRSELWKWIAEKYPAFSHVQFDDERQDGIRVNLGQKENPFSSQETMGREKEWKKDGGLKLLAVDWTFGTEELSAYSEFIQQVEEEPYLLMHPVDASTIGIEKEERITLHLDRGPVMLKLRVADNMAPGVIILPRHRQLAWQKIEKWPAKVTADQIKK